jgi:DNA-binding NarL/FixJ family response regulator
LIAKFGIRVKIIACYAKGVSMKKIVIIDDHQLFLYGLKLTLENEHHVVTIFDSPLRALAEIKDNQPDLILMDLSMPEMSGGEMLEALMVAGVSSPVVILSACENYHDVYCVLQNGAMGFIPKSYSPDEMLQGLDCVLQGHLFVPDDVQVEIELIAQQTLENKQCFNLSDRQEQILKLIHSGKNNREIAEELGISQDTVKFHQKGLYNTLNVSGASSRFKAVEKALSIGLLKS